VASEGGWSGIGLIRRTRGIGSRESGRPGKPPRHTIKVFSTILKKGGFSQELRDSGGCGLREKSSKGVLRGIVRRRGVPTKGPMGKVSRNGTRRIQVRRIFGIKI